MSVDVGAVASALVSSDTSYEPRISFFMRGMNLVLSNPRGEAWRGRTQQPGSYAKTTMAYGRLLRLSGSVSEHIQSHSNCDNLSHHINIVRGQNQHM
jgi:hypothetical protein